MNSVIGVTRADIVIVGGGVTGLSLAFELARLGRRDIVVLERRFTGAGGSGRNVGRIRAMQLTEELARFAIAAQAKHAALADELGANTLFWRAGYGWVLYEEPEMTRMAEVRDMLRGLALSPELVGTAETLRRLPVLAGGERPAGALFHRDAIVHHDAVLYAYRAACRRFGVHLIEDCEAIEPLVSGREIAGVKTASGDIRAPIVVNAAGGWSAAFSARAGVSIPNTPLRREALVTEAARPFMQAAITFYRPSEGWFNQTLRGELVAGCLAPAEAPGVNLAASARSLGRTARTILAKAPRLGHLRVVRQWAGVYDMTPDRKPMVGPMSRLSGFVQANGCNGRGFLLGPLIGELLARWLDSGERPALLAGFDANRFEGRDDVKVETGDYYAGYTAAGRKP
jgi:sarcosine oxidase subunit beta